VNDDEMVFITTDFSIPSAVLEINKVVQVQIIGIGDTAFSFPHASSSGGIPYELHPMRGSRN
jgi:hypothetical protein